MYALSDLGSRRRKLGNMVESGDKGATSDVGQGTSHTIDKHPRLAGVACPGNLCLFRGCIGRLFRSVTSTSSHVFVTMHRCLRLLRPSAKLRWTRDPGRRWLSVPAAELRFGQPLHETHPHLLKAGEGATLSSPIRRMLTGTSGCSHSWHHGPRIL
jgi:hypothetical protein